MRLGNGERVKAGREDVPDAPIMVRALSELYLRGSLMVVSVVGAMMTWMMYVPGSVHVRAVVDE